jgi:MFS family permease
MRETPSMVKARSLPPTVVALAIVSLLHDLAGDMVTPLVPMVVATMGGGPAALGLIEGIADATASLLKLVSGHLADRVGRLKALTVAGYGVANVLRPLLALAGSWWQVLLLRFGDRVGKGLRGTPRDALMAAVTTPETRGRAYGFHHALESLGAVIGTLVGYLLLAGGLSVRQVIAWSALPGILTMAFVVVAVKDSPRVTPASTAVRVGLPPTPGFKRFLTAAVVFTLGNSSDAFLLWRAHELGVAVALGPLLWALLHVTRSATATWGGAMSDRRGRRFAIVAGWLVYAVTYAGFAAARAQWQAWLLFAIYGTYYGLTEGAQKALVVDMVPSEWRGRALGALQMAIGLAILPASALFGLAYKRWGASAAFGVGAALALVASSLVPPASTEDSPIS